MGRDNINFNDDDIDRMILKFPYFSSLYMCVYIYMSNVIILNLYLYIYIFCRCNHVVFVVSILHVDTKTIIGYLAIMLLVLYIVWPCLLRVHVCIYNRFYYQLKDGNL